MSKRISQEAIRRMIDSSGGSGGGGGSIDPSALAGLASMAWVEEGYISKAFFNELFIIHKKATTVVKDGDTVISTTVDTSGTFAPNEIPDTTSETDSETGYVTTVTTEVSSIESKKGFWTNYFLSALGLNSGGGSLSLNEPLLSINNAGLSTPSESGVAIMWNGSAWTYQVPGGGSGGGGTVTSVGLTMPTGFSVAGQPVTGSGTLAVSFGGSVAANRVLASPNGSSGAPSWRALVSADIPDLSNIYVVTSAINDMATMTWVGQQGFLTSSAISDMATKTWVGQQGFLTSSAISDMATKTWVGQQGFLTSASGTFWGKSWSNGGTVNGTIYAGSGGGSIEQFTSIELNSAGTLSNYGGFIDFHYNAQGTTFDPTVDYTSRIIEDASGVINLNNALYAKLSGNVSIGTSTISNTYKLNVNGYTKTTRLYLTDSVYLMYDSANSGVKLVGAGFYTDSYVSALGLNSGSGGVTLNEPLNAINNAGLGTPTQSGVAIMWNGSAWTYQVPGGGSGGGGTVTSVGLTMPTGFSVAGQPVTGSGTIIITFANGYSLPLTTDVNKGVTAYGWGDHGLAGYATQSWVGQQGYLTSSAISDMATKTWVGQQGYITSSAISDMATKTWVGQQGYLTSSAITDMATKTWVGQQGYLTSSAISDMATKTWVGQQGFLTQNAGDGRYASLTSANNLVYNNNEITVIPTGFVGQGGKLWINYSCGTDSSNANFTAYHMGNGTRGTTNGGYADVTANGFVKNGSTDSYVLLGGGGHKLESGLSVGTASKLSTTQTYTAWGQTYWSGGVPQSILGDIRMVPSGGETNSDSAKIDFRTLSGNDYVYAPYIQAISVNNYGRKRLSVFQKSQSDWTTAQTEVFTIWPTGTVGINTSSPNTNYKLDVNGYTKTSRLYLSDTIYMVVQNDGIHIVGGGLYADTYVSALGLSDSGSSSVSALADLIDVSVSSLSNNQGLVYNSSSGKWENVTLFTEMSYSNNILSITVSGVTKTVPIQAGSSGVTSVATGTGLTGGTITSTGTISINSTYQDYISHGESAYNSLSSYLPLSGGTMTGTLKVATGIGIEDATGNGLLCYHPTNWTGVTNVQWGAGAVDCQGVIRSNASNLLHYRGSTSYNILDGYNSGISGSTITINGTSINSVAHIEVGTNDLTGYSGSFFFGGENALQSGYDYVGFQAGNSADKWQMVAIDTLKWRQNDSGGTSTSWGLWYNITDNLYIEKELSSAGWYRVADVSIYGGSIILSTSQNYYYSAPNPATFIISHGYSGTTVSQYDSIVQLGGSGYIGAVRNVRLMRYGNGKVYIEIYYANNSANTVGVELTPIGRILHGYITPIDFTAVTSTSGLTLADSCPVMPGGVSGVGYTGAGGQQNPDFFGRNKVGFLMSNQTVNGDSTYKNWIYMDCYHGTDAGGTTALGVSRTNGRVFVMQSTSARSSWGTLREVITTDANSSNVTLSGSLIGLISIELNSSGGLSGYGGFIDFHYDGTSNDYSSRFIETDYGLMKLMSKNSSGTNQRAAFVVGEGYTSSYIQIGDIRMVYDSNHNLRVVKADGTPASLYATGGISALGMSAGTSSIDSMTFGYLKVNNQLTFGNNYASIYMDDFFYINSSSTISINGVECDGNGNIYTNGNARANRFYLDSNRYLYVTSGTLYYYNGSTSKAVAFTN